MNKRTLGNLLLILTAFIWGVAFVAQRAGMDSIEPITFTSARMALGALTVGIVSLVLGRMGKKGMRSGAETSGSSGQGMVQEDRRGQPTTAETENRGCPIQETGEKGNLSPEETAYGKNTVIGGICCGLFLVSASIFQQMGVVYTSAGKAGFITALYILLVPVISFIFFRKKNSWLVWAAVALGVVGMYLLCMNEGLTLTRGDSLVLVCAFLFSGHILCCDYFAGRGDPIRISAIQFLVVALISGVLAFIFEEPSLDKLMAALIPILYCGIMSAGVGYTLQLVAQRYTDPTVASMLMSLEAVFAVISGAIILHERMSLRELLGCVVMFIAIILVQLPKKDTAEKDKL